MKQNIIVIIIDTLRAQNMSLYGYHRKTTPVLDELAKDAVVFNTAFSCINTTDPSLTSIFSGMNPRNHGITNHGPKVTSEEEERLTRSGVPLLPEILKTQGYETAAFDWLSRWHKRGYDQYIDSNKEEQQSRSVRNIYHRLPTPLKKPTRRVFSFVEKKAVAGDYEASEEAKELTDAALNLIPRMKQPFFLFLHYWDVHAPYNPPLGHLLDGYDPGERIEDVAERLHPSITSDTLRKLASSTKAETVGDFIARYDAEIRFTDQQLGKLIRFLQQNVENPIIILTGDHGESLGEHGIYFDHHGLYDVNIQVPLIIWGLEGKGRVDGLVQHTDILPTLLHHLRIPSPPMDGVSLLPLIKGQVDKVRDWIFIEEYHTQRKMGIRTNQHKYIRALAPNCRYCNTAHGDSEELYDLHADPEEKSNIAESQPEVAKQLKEHLPQLE